MIQERSIAGSWNYVADADAKIDFERKCGEE